MNRLTNFWSKPVVYITLPLLLLAVFIISFLKFGPLGIFTTAVAPIEDIAIQKVAFAPEEIIVDVYNNGPEPVTIAQVLINNAYWQFEMTPNNTLLPRDKGRISVFYPWLSGDPEIITLVSGNGVVFEEEVEAATITPRPNADYIKAFVLLGLYVGVIPVLLGIMFLPILRRLRGQWHDFLISLTVGLLLFLGIDAVAEAFELIPEIPSSLNGVGIFVIGLLVAILSLAVVSYKTEHLFAAKEEHFRALTLGYLIALGIGLHNLGEGLAIGSAYAIGAVALGSSLVIGFMLHNITEGIAIVTPLSKTIKNVRKDLHHIILMGMLAGLPTIIGSVVGGFAYSKEFALLFLAFGAGAIFEVTYDILHGMAKDRWFSIFTPTNVLGFLLGLLTMYITGFLVLG